MNAIMLLIMKVVFSGTGIDVGMGRYVVTVFCLFVAVGQFEKATQMNVPTQLDVRNRQNVHFSVPECV